MKHGRLTRKTDKNHDGSPASMEAAAAITMFKRSVAKHKLRYTLVLSDGDTKTVQKLNKEEVYMQKRRS